MAVAGAGSPVRAARPIPPRATAGTKREPPIGHPQKAWPAPAKPSEPRVSREQAAPDSSDLQSPFPVAKKAPQRRDVVLVGANRNRIDPFLTEVRRTSSEVRAPASSRKARRTARIGSIQFDLLSRFGILEGEQADVRQLFLAGIDDRDGDQVMTAAGDGKFARKIGRLKIGDEENDGAAMQHFI